MSGQFQTGLGIALALFGSILLIAAFIGFKFDKINLKIIDLTLSRPLTVQTRVQKTIAILTAIALFIVGILVSFWENRQPTDRSRISENPTLSSTASLILDPRDTNNPTNIFLETQTVPSTSPPSPSTSTDTPTSTLTHTLTPTESNSVTSGQDPTAIDAATGIHTATTIGVNGIIELVLFRDKDYLALFIPEERSVSLQNITLEVQRDTREKHRLEEYEAFAGLDFGNIQGPFCFLLKYDQSTLTPPDECQRLTAQQRPTAEVSKANVFWLNFFSGQGYMVFVMRDSEELGHCPGSENRCRISLQ